MSKLDRTKMGKAKAHRCFSTPKISSSITSRGTNHSEGSRGNSRVAPTTDSLAGGAPIAPASPSPERGERSPSQEWRQQLASSLLTPSCWARARRSVRPAARLALRTCPGVAAPIRRAGKRIRSAKATEPPHLGQTLLLRGKTAVVVDAFPGIGRAPASAGPRRLAPLRARPALGVSVGEQQSHYCDTEQNKTDRAHGSSDRLTAAGRSAKQRPSYKAIRTLHPAGAYLTAPEAYQKFMRAKALQEGKRKQASENGRANNYKRPCQQFPHASVRQASHTADQSSSRSQNNDIITPEITSYLGFSRPRYFRRGLINARGPPSGHQG